MGISAKRLKEIEAIQDKDIDYSEIPEADEGFWKRVELQMPQPKKGIYIRLDTDVIDWLKSKGKGYPDPDERHAARVDAKRARAEGSSWAALMVVTSLAASSGPCDLVMAIVHFLHRPPSNICTATPSPHTVLQKLYAASNLILVHRGSRVKEPFATCDRNGTSQPAIPAPKLRVSSPVLLPRPHAQSRRGAGDRETPRMPDS